MRLASILYLASAMAVLTACASLPDVIFAIGQDDQSPAEFALAQGSGWQHYASTFKNPVIFTVAKSNPSCDWPYIHPNTHDKWAGSQTHPFTIRFTLPEGPSKPLTLVIGQVNALSDPTIAISVNGQALQRVAAPAGSGDSSGRAEGTQRPERTLFTLAPESFRAGDNELVITLEKGSWLIYDYVLLCTKVPAAYAPPDLTQQAAALRSGEYGLFNEIVFATRNTVSDGHWYANFGYYCTSPERVTYGTQGRLCAWNFQTGATRLLIDDPEGTVRDPCVSYDARKIVFSYRRKGAPHYHLYEIGADGSGLRQLTDGGYDDLEPCYLPDGGIVFVSGRAKRWVNCWLTQVATVHRCDADGRNVRMLSANIEQDNTPWPLPDGRLIYMRWEYVDRNQVNYHHLWTMNPDGTQHSVFFGNLHPGGLFIDAKPIPHSTDVLFIDSPGHGNIEHKGFVARVSAKQGPDVKQNLRRISKSSSFRDPWALSDSLFLAARDRDLVLLDGNGTEKVLFSLPDAFKECWLHEPRPIMPRAKEPVIADKTDPSQPNGVFFLENVYEGRQMAGVEPGTVKKLLILESLPKPINFTGGMDPLSYVGTFTLPRVLGTVPVDADGSAHFAVPALRPVFFVALDARGRSIKRMQSFTQLMPGERQGCTGCHEERVSAPRLYASANAVTAARRPPSEIDASGLAFDVPDFPRYVQPVLDRHCVRCHNPDDRKGGVDLSGDRGPMFSMGYYTLAVWRQITDGRNFAKSNYAPYSLGSGGSPLMGKLDGSHHGAQPSRTEVEAIALWLDASAPYPGTYGALGCGMIGGYLQNNQTLENDKDWTATRAAQPVFEKRCSSCHTQTSSPLPRYLSDENGVSFWSPDLNDPRLRRSRHNVFNLTRPEKSLFVRAPLAKAAGGLGLCRLPHDTNAAVFASADDPGYRALLAMVAAGSKRLEEIKRFDMPGFRPRPEYLREMKRYGILPASFDLDKDPVDPYALDRLYWDSFIYKPSQTAVPRP